MCLVLCSLLLTWWCWVWMSSSSCSGSTLWTGNCLAKYAEVPSDHLLFWFNWHGRFLPWPGSRGTVYVAPLRPQEEGESSWAWSLVEKGIWQALFGCRALGREPQSVLPFLCSLIHPSHLMMSCEGQYGNYPVLIVLFCKLILPLF